MYPVEQQQQPTVGDMAAVIAQHYQRLDDLRQYQTAAGSHRRAAGA